MDRRAEERPRIWGRVAGLFYVLNIISGSLALVFIRRELALYADAANLTATISARNAFNHTNLGQPNGVISSPFFGESTSLASGGGPGGGFGGGGGAAGNRRIELQLRFTF